MAQDVRAGGENASRSCNWTFARSTVADTCDVVAPSPGGGHVVVSRPATSEYASPRIKCG